MSKSKSSKKKSKLKHILLLVFVLAVLGGGYFYIDKLERENPQGYVAAPLVGKNESSQYVLLENTDSIKYQAIVIYNNDININDVAVNFYNSDVFWPYIFLENKDVITNPLDIKKDIVLRIPRLSSKSLSIDDTKSIEQAKYLADSILSKSVNNEGY